MDWDEAKELRRTAGWCAMSAFLDERAAACDPVIFAGDGIEEVTSDFDCVQDVLVDQIAYTILQASDGDHTFYDIDHNRLNAEYPYIMNPEPNGNNSPLPGVQCCYNCRHWQPTRDDDEHDVLGKCGAHPPMGTYFELYCDTFDGYMDEAHLGAANFYRHGPPRFHIDAQWIQRATSIDITNMPPGVTNGQ